VKWIAIGIQVFGISLTLLGIAVIRSWLESAKDAAVESSKGLRRWWILDPAGRALEDLVGSTPWQASECSRLAERNCESVRIGHGDRPPSPG
jgi:hypothetical protein